MNADTHAKQSAEFSFKKVIQWLHKTNEQRQFEETLEHFYSTTERILKTLNETIEVTHGKIENLQGQVQYLSHQVETYAEEVRNLKAMFPKGSVH